MLLAAVCFATSGCSSWFEGDEVVPAPKFTAIGHDGKVVDGKGIDGAGVDAGVVADAGPMDSKTPADVFVPPAECKPPCSPGYQCFDQGINAMPLCLPDGDRACLACSLDLHCLGGECIAVAGAGTFCAIPCANAAGGSSSCPDGFLCVGGPEGPRCRPESGDCTCTPALVGNQRPCGSSAKGCGGVQTCTVDGWGLCDAPAAKIETCNGLDDDCDGQVDQGLPEDQPCSRQGDAGSCAGTATCHGAKGWLCDAAKPAEEICNGLDDDCDGSTDEPWLNEGKYVAGVHCGVCNNSCADVFKHGVGTCDPNGFPPHCVVATCDPGYVLGPAGVCEPKSVGACTPCAVNTDCGPSKLCSKLPKPIAGQSTACTTACTAGKCGPGFTCAAVSGKARCLPTLGTCTCSADNAGQKRPCTKTGDAGTCSGLQTCKPPHGWLGCTAANPLAETCNGLDDDCDGKIDEGVGVGKPCAKTSPIGSCAGKNACAGSAGPFCNAPTPAVETCDGKDNDCDGDIDEDFQDANTGTWTLVNHCGGCGKTCPLINSPNASATCTAKGGKFLCGMACKPGFHDANGIPGDGCECKSAGVKDDPGGADENCDGVAGNASKAVFVAKIGKDTWPGTPDKPVRTIGMGIALAKAKSRPQVHVAAGAYVENVILKPGISLWGGFGKVFTVRDALAYETLIQGAAPALGDAFTLRCIGPSGWSGGTPTAVDGFTIAGAHAKAAGASSYAVHLLACGNGLRLANNRIIAGTGAGGAAGKQGASGKPGKSGKSGHKAYDIGQKTCTVAKHNPGGGGASGLCGKIVAYGGKGGNGICPDFNEKIKPPQCSLGQQFAQTAWPTERGSKGAGAKGGKPGMPGGDGYIDPHNGFTTKCNIPTYGCSDCVVPWNSLNGKDGGPGGAGSPGWGGAGCKGGGAIVNGLWKGAGASSGGPGTPGSGGAGGGAAGGVEVISCWSKAGYSDIGGSGGGGGAGGCGGAGGAGGGQGGAAFALMATLTGPTLPVVVDNILVGGNGGAGGPGGSGGYGGAGGAPGLGGAGAYDKEWTKCAYHGGRGGKGGNGGHAGGGGGGCGGPAITVGLFGAKSKSAWPGWAKTNQLVAKGKGGKGGTGGKSAAGQGAGGAAGKVAEVVTWP